MIRFKHSFDTRPVLDMTPDGQFRDPPARVNALTQIGGIAVLVAVAAGALGVAALVLWFALAIIPIALAAGLVAYVIFRFQLWRSRGQFPLTRRPPF